MSDNYLIKGADLLGTGRADLLIEDGVITEVGSPTAKGATVIDADGLVALPGLVDLHTHLREPGREDADAGRRQEAQQLLDNLRQKHGDPLAGR